MMMMMMMLMMIQGYEFWDQWKPNERLRIAIMLVLSLNRKEQLRRRAVSLQQHGFLVIKVCSIFGIGFQKYRISVRFSVRLTFGKFFTIDVNTNNSETTTSSKFKRPNS